ncbi:MAG: bifunctional precorrin-2 dehydrogenase/sirohydrochlorin ferrochelatase [Candidatus Omnitrophota bacterium]
MSYKIYYPVNLDLNGRKCLVVGGGEVAARKARTLAAFGGRVTVISPALDRMLARQVRSGKISYVPGRYTSRCMAGAFVVVAATDDPVVNKTVFRHAVKRNILVNVVDVPELCTFIVPSMVRRGPLVLGISTSGQSPMFAQRQKKMCEACRTPRHGDFVRMMGSVRDRIKREYATIPERKAVHAKIMDSKILDLVLAGKAVEARALLHDILYCRRECV